jgi:AcrR family transcriptional regulator
MARISKPPAERKQEIIETALALFSEKGYDHTTIQDIAERMNVAQGLCYRYFKTKQDIFAASSDYYAQQAIVQLDQYISKNSSTIDKFNSVIKFLLAYAIKHGEFEASYHNEKEISAERIQRMAIHISDIIIPIVEQGRNEGLFDCKKVADTVRILTFGIMNLIHYNMPKQNVQKHILSFIPTIKTVCKDMLQSNSHTIGKGWGQI